MRIVFYNNCRKYGEIFSNIITMLNVVMAPRVINNCLPSLTTRKIFEGSESKSTILAAFLGSGSSTVHCQSYITFG